MPAFPLVLFKGKLRELSKPAVTVDCLAKLESFFIAPSDLSKRGRTELALLACNLGLSTQDIDPVAAKLITIPSEQLAESIVHKVSQPVQSVKVKAFGMSGSGYVILTAGNMKHSYFKLPSFMCVDTLDDILKYKVDAPNDMLDFSIFSGKLKIAEFATMCASIGLKSYVMKKKANKSYVTKPMEKPLIVERLDTLMQ